MSSSFGVHFISTMVRWGGGRVGGSFKDDAMCTQLTVARETAWGHASSYRGDWQQQQHTKIIREIEKTYVRKKWWTKKKKHEQNEVMKSNPPNPVAERKPCDRSRSTVTYKYQLWDNNLASTFRKRTTNTNQRGWQRSRHKSRKCQKWIWC